ncbi:MAG TPA: hypothetical protein VHX62_06975 [Solirubrobacteraceae bacterium]|jgi:hypothetical protein|nr:hypothetical protein [Solirubrobacteraceae bacterium]
MARPVIRLIVVRSRPDLLRHRPAEHVENLVPLIARVTKPDSRLPDLGRISVPKLGRDDLMHREVETRVDPIVAKIHLSEPVVQSLFELRVLTWPLQDENR